MGEFNLFMVSACFWRGRLCFGGGIDIFAKVIKATSINRSFVLYIFSIFTGVWRVCECMCVDAHTHTRTASGYSGFESKCRDGAFREYEEIQMDSNLE